MATCMPTMVESPKPSKRSKLTCNDLLFLNEYLKNGRNGTQAYRAVHPKTSYGVASCRAYQVLQKPTTQAELGKRIQYQAGITRELVDSNLLHALDLANEAKDAAVIASVTMDCAKLAGFLIERREVKQISDAEQTSVKELVNRTLRTLIASPSRQTPTSDAMNTANALPSATVDASTATENQVANG